MLKTFEQYSKDINLIDLLVKANVINKEISKSEDFINRLNVNREKTLLEQLLIMLIDFNEAKDLDYTDFWNKEKFKYNLNKNIRSLDAEKSLEKFFKLDNNNKLWFNSELRNSFFEYLQIPTTPEGEGEFVAFDTTRDGSITVGPDKDNVKVVVKKVTDIVENSEYINVEKYAKVIYNVLSEHDFVKNLSIFDRKRISFSIHFSLITKVSDLKDYIDVNKEKNEVFYKLIKLMSDIKYDYSECLLEMSKSSCFIDLEITKEYIKKNIKLLDSLSNVNKYNL